MTELKDKAIDIKWKKYVLVSDRVLYFNENYPNGCIQTTRETIWDKEIIKAAINWILKFFVEKYLSISVLVHVWSSSVCL